MPMPASSPPAVARPAILDQLVGKLRTALGTDLVAVVLHGSAATDGYQEQYSDYNVLCVLREVTPVQLRAAESVLRWWRAHGNPSPLLLSEHEVRNSTDCFAIEFHDIREHHQILYGEDVVAGLTIDDSFYRGQVEHDLRAKLLRLRQKASGILSDKDVLRRLLVDSISTFCVLFRHALILHGAEAPARQREIIGRAHERFAIVPAPFTALLDLREGRAKAKEIDPEALLAAYLNEIGKVIDAVDVLEK
jgi:hypothetical protein